MTPLFIILQRGLLLEHAKQSRLRKPRGRKCLQANVNLSPVEKSLIFCGDAKSGDVDCFHFSRYGESLMKRFKARKKIQKDDLHATAAGTNTVRDALNIKLS